MKKSLYLLSLCICIALITACNKVEPNPFSTDETEFIIQAEGGPFSVKLTHTTDFSVDIDENCNWVSQITTKSKSGYTVTELDFMVEENTAFEPRSTRIIISSDTAPTMTVLKVKQEAAIQTNLIIPDALFKEWLVKNFDLDNDMEISFEEAEKITQIDIGEDLDTYTNDYGAFITSLEGIEHMPNLQSFRFEACNWDNYNNGYLGKLKHVDFSGNTALKELIITFCPLDGLDVSMLTNLEKLDCSTCHLKSLDVSKNTKLTHLNCGMENELETLDVSNNTELIQLCCGFDGSDRLYLQEYNDVGRDIMHGNKLTSLDLTSNKKLELLDCSSNFITSLDLSSNPNLKYLICMANKLTTINISNNTNLEFVDLGADLGDLEFHTHPGNFLETVRFSNHPKLESIRISTNNLTTLELSGCPNVTELICDHNELTSIDISKLTSLRTLLCDYNSLSSLNVSNNNDLDWLVCRGNDMTELDLSGKVKMTALDCSNTHIKNLTVTNLPLLRTLRCTNSGLESIDVSGCSALNYIVLNENNLKELDFSTCTNIDEFDTIGNPELKTIWVAEGFVLSEHQYCEIDPWTEVKVK